MPVALVLGGTVILIGYTAHHLIDLVIGIPLILIIWIGIFKAIKKFRKIPGRRDGGSSNPTVQPPTLPNSPASGSLFPNNPSSPSPTDNNSTPNDSNNTQIT